MDSKDNLIPSGLFEKSILYGTIKSKNEIMDFKNQVYSLSYFLCNKNSSYTYNFNFLPTAYDEFLKFQQGIYAKQETLNSILKSLKSNPTITNDTELTLTLNDTIYAHFPEMACLCEPLNIEGATRVSNDDTITVSINNITRSYRLKDIVDNNYKELNCKISNMIDNCGKEDKAHG